VNRSPAWLGWGPYDDARGWLRGLLVTLAAALFLGYAGAFGSIQLPLFERLGYWLVLMLLGWIWGAFVSRQVFGRFEGRMNTWLRAVLSAVALAIPFSAVVAYAGVWAFHSRYRFADIPGLIASVTLVSIVMVFLMTLVERHATTQASDQPPKFLQRLPLKLRGADVWAVEAEDHYLRLHTSKGQDLILMRLGDAIAELQGIEGAQVHRSWWIARDAITDAERGDGRATLTLKDGAEVPVSRTYARVLREKRWI
jgi:DNA-binding LytR/AlgR family response regulator